MENRKEEKRFTKSGRQIMKPGYDQMDGLDDIDEWDDGAKRKKRKFENRKQIADEIDVKEEDSLANMAEKVSQKIAKPCMVMPEPEKKEKEKQKSIIIADEEQVKKEEERETEKKLKKKAEEPEEKKEKLKSIDEEASKKRGKSLKTIEKSLKALEKSAKIAKPEKIESNSHQEVFITAKPIPVANSPIEAVKPENKGNDSGAPKTDEVRSPPKKTDSKTRKGICCVIL